MIETAEKMVGKGATKDACAKLMEIYQKMDGDAVPPDFIEGEAVPELAGMIQDQRATLGCK